MHPWGIPGEGGRSGSRVDYREGGGGRGGSRGSPPHPGGGAIGPEGSFGPASQEGDIYRFGRECVCFKPAAPSPGAHRPQRVVQGPSRCDVHVAPRRGATAPSRRDGPVASRRPPSTGAVSYVLQCFCSVFIRFAMFLCFHTCSHVLLWFPMLSYVLFTSSYGLQGFHMFSMVSARFCMFYNSFHKCLFTCSFGLKCFHMFRYEFQVFQ